MTEINKFPHSILERLEGNSDYEELITTEDKYLITIHYPEFWKSVQYCISKKQARDHRIAFVYFHCYGWICPDGGYIVYGEKEPHILSTENLEEATPLIGGQVKFDGSMFFYLGFEDDGYHDISGMKDLKRLTNILIEIYSQAKHLMTNPITEQWEE